MAEFEKLSLVLDAEQVAVLKEAVASGDYFAPSEIVSEALRDWQVKRELSQNELQRIRRLIAEGEASGPARPVDFEELRKEAKRRLRAQARHLANAS